MYRVDKNSDLNFNNRFSKVNFVRDYLSEIQISFAYSVDTVNSNSIKFDSFPGLDGINGERG